MQTDGRAQLQTPEGAVQRLSHDTLIHLVRQSGPLRGVRVAIQASWDSARFREDMAAHLATLGWPGVEVVCLPTQAEPRLLSVWFG